MLIKYYFKCVMYNKTALHPALPTAHLRLDVLPLASSSPIYSRQDVSLVLNIPLARSAGSPGCGPSQHLVKINVILAEARTLLNCFVSR